MYVNISLPRGRGGHGDGGTNLEHQSTGPVCTDHRKKTDGKLIIYFKTMSAVVTCYRIFIIQPAAFCTRCISITLFLFIIFSFLEGGVASPADLPRTCQVQVVHVFYNKYGSRESVLLPQ